MSYVISEILKRRKITDYLHSKGISPVGSPFNGKIKYRCPIHKGDNTPSFMVYTNGEFENFYCYGCRNRYHIIHLYKALENVSTQDAIKALSDGLALDLNSELEHIIREIEEDKTISHEFTPVDLSLIISRQLYDYLKIVEKTPEECVRVDKLFESVDDAVDRCDMKALQETYEYLSDLLVDRIRYHEAEKEKKILMYAKINEQLSTH